MFESDSSEEDEELTTSVTSSSVVHGGESSLPYVTDGGNASAEVVYESVEFINAKNSIAKNSYDKNAWKVLLEEAERSEHKSAILDSYCSATIQFPRAATMWLRYTQHLIRFGEISQAEDCFRKCLAKCRCVELWDHYLSLVRSRTVAQHSSNSDQYSNTRKTYESAFETAIENIGFSLDANIIWRKYIDFVLEWPDAREIDSGKKLTALRDLYQRAVSSPMDHLDSFWREYEEWEMKAGKHLAEQLLPEFKRKYQDARNIYKDRKKLFSGIDLTHMAAPPSLEGSLVEMKQLELWNHLIKSELKSFHDNSDAQRRQFFDFLFDRFLACFFLHPEAWMMLSRCELTFFSAVNARNALKEAILVIPNTPTLWLALSELEEKNGDVESAADILRLCFEQIPNSFTFSLLQKFIRRRDGKVAARKLFSDTILLRDEGVLGLEVYVAHAALELEANNQPITALRILESAREMVPTAYSSIAYIKILTRTLVRLGDFRQLRWVYEANIGLLENNETLSKGNSKFTAKESLQLWEALLQAELTMGMSDTSRLMLLQERIRLARAESDKNSITSQDNIDLFEPIQQLYSRHNVAASFPSCDEALNMRVSGILTSDKGDGHDQRTDQMTGGKTQRRKRDDAPPDGVELSGVPIFLRDLLVALPSHVGPVPNTDNFIDQLRRTVLPPRPISEKGSASNDTLLGLGGSVPQDTSIQAGNKRKLLSTDDDADYDRDANYADNKNDVFRQRRRVKLTPS